MADLAGWLLPKVDLEGENCLATQEASSDRSRKMSDLLGMWMYRGRLVEVRKVGPYPQRGPGDFVLAVPERTPEEQRAASGRIQPGGYHFTDWCPMRTFLIHAERCVEETNNDTLKGVD